MIESETLQARTASPITVLTGFLGAGKTTLLNRILNGSHGLRMAVLVNDFGSINIDADLVTGIEDDVISLANGCVCCSVRDDLVATVMTAIGRPEMPEYILLEASGVADPIGISLAFLDPDLRDRIRLDSVMCVVDAEQAFAAAEMMELKIRQMAFADMIILNKEDLVDRTQITKLNDWLESRFQRYRLLKTSRGQVPLEILLPAGRFDPTRLDNGPRAAGHNARGEPGCGDDSHAGHKAFDTWSYETDAPLSLETLRGVVTKLPSDVYRAKGIIYSAETPEWRAVLQLVGKRPDISLHDEWGSRPPYTRIVVIGAAGSLDDPELRARFDSCRAGHRSRDRASENGIGLVR